MDSTTLGLVGLVATVVLAVLGIRLWKSPRPRLIPVLDEPWSNPDSSAVRNLVVVNNTSEFDAMRVSIDDVDLGHGTILTTKGAEAFIKAKGTHTFTLLVQEGTQGVFAYRNQRRDIPDAVRAASATVWPVYANFRDDRDRVWRAVWRLQNDMDAHRIRLICVDHFRA